MVIQVKALNEYNSNSVCAITNASSFSCKQNIKVWPFKWKLSMSYIVCVITEKSSLAYVHYLDRDSALTSKMTKDLCGLLQNDCNNCLTI